jgi:hypothetical protein
MTAHRPHDVTLDHPMVLRFAAYLHREPIAPNWGVFHGSLAEGRWNVAAPWGVDGVGFSQVERELVAVFDRLTPSQRRRLRRAPPAPRP